MKIPLYLILKTRKGAGLYLEEFYIGQQVYEDGIEKIVIGFWEKAENDTLIVEVTPPGTRHSIEQYLPIIEKERHITTKGQSFYQIVRPYLYEKNLLERPA